MKVLFIGDIVGSVGREAVRQVLPALRDKYNPHIIIANGENAAAGRGITRPIANDFFNWGIHGITMGNHTWDNKNIFEWIDDEPRIVRPANFSEVAPGRGMAIINVHGKKLAIINIQGRTFLPPIDCPFRTAEALIEEAKQITPHILVDFHAEVTSEKIAMGWYLDGQASIVVGTHTHVQTNDDTILPQGTAYLTDVGMVGSKEGVLGMEKEAVLHRFLTQMPTRFVVDEGKWHLHGIIAELDDQTGRATKIEKIRLTEESWLLMQ
ncbi:TIGR00282 family metallophosphoesterase [Paenibacillus endoradicis]|uniref:TIGR00282 family metallophosphoesterase n=1 Tax=Paenibacillus endoradicis TaxID=2972487 RepID=UPI00215957C4|nr:TIGR00282 family metallophosphoesterase [Paenibacillus endoradicis]MCR8656333.1 TIGR00282 family metallophosphoesterase [Paenibacillus endoradicis]